MSRLRVRLGMDDRSPAVACGGESGSVSARVRGCRSAGRSALLLAVAVALIAFGGVTEARGHGQRVLPLFIEVLSGESVRMDVSFDVMFIRPAEVVDRAWLAALSEREMEEVAVDAERFLRSALWLELGGVRLPMEVQTPDLERLRDPEFDNGEPEGHILVSLSGPLDPAGGPLTLTLDDLGNMPSVVATVELDGKPRRRPIVAIAGETRPVCDVPSLEGQPAVEPVPDDSIPGLLGPDESGEAGSVRMPTPSARAFLELGWRHVFPAGWDHWLLVAVVFALAVGWRSLLAQWGALVIGAAAGALLPVVALGGVPEWAGLLVMAMLGIEGVLMRKVMPWRLGALAALGFAHSSAFAAGTLPGVESIAAVSFAGGVECAHAVLLFGAFVLVGWSWGADWYRTRIGRPLSALAALGLLTLAVIRLTPG